MFMLKYLRVELKSKMSELVCLIDVKKSFKTEIHPGCVHRHSLTSSLIVVAVYQLSGCLLSIYSLAS